MVLGLFNCFIIIGQLELSVRKYYFIILITDGCSIRPVLDNTASYIA